MLSDSLPTAFGPVKNVICLFGLNGSRKLYLSGFNSARASFSFPGFFRAELRSFVLTRAISASMSLAKSESFEVASSPSITEKPVSYRFEFVNNLCWTYSSFSFGVLDTRPLVASGRPPIFDSPVTRYAPEETLAYEKVIERIIASSLSWMQIKRHFPCDPGLEALLRSRGKNANSDAIVGIGIVSAYYC